MKRTRNAVRNVIFGGLLKGYQILVPFIMRTLLIRYLGMEYLGLNSLFTSILQILNLAELGVGSALGYSMYAPIAEGKKDEICALLSLYRRYYRLIGLGIFLAGIVLLPFLPSLVKTDSIPPDVDLYVLYLLHLGACVISYWLFAYKNSLLAAHQRSDLANKADLAVRTLQYLIQAGLLVGFRNYYWYLLAALGAQILTNLCTALVAQKNYPDYVPRGQVEEQTRQKIRGKIKDLFTSRVGVVIVNSADTLVISAFLGLTVLAVYQNYYYIVTSVIGLVGVLFTSTLAGIGNSLLTESRGKNYADFCKFTLLIAWIAGLCTCCLLCLLQPFMKLWIGEAGILPGQIVICLCMCRKNNRQIIPVCIRFTYQIPHTRCKIHPFVITFFLTPAHLISYHQSVDCINYNHFDSRASFCNSFNILTDNICIVACQIVFVLFVILFSPSLPRKSLLVSVDIVC